MFNSISFAITSFLQFTAYYVTAARTCSSSRKDLTFFRQNNVKLNVLTEQIISMQVTDQPEDCLGICRSVTNCTSVNVAHNGHKYTCQLLNIDRFQFPTYLTKQSNYMYFEVKRDQCSLVDYRGYVSHANDCLDIFHKGFYEDGIYNIDWNNKSIHILCDMTTPPGGWTIFQKRLDGSVDFKRDWGDYKRGFGNLKSEFWIGNELLHSITKVRSNSVNITLKAFGGDTYEISYDTFNINSELSKYRLTVGDPSRSEHKDGLLYHTDTPFTTFDEDNDNRANMNCANLYHGGWWYNDCHHSNLNGKYFKKIITGTEGIAWDSYRNRESMMETVMKTRGKLNN